MNAETPSTTPSTGPHPRHTAEPSALEDPVHHDVAVHELHEERESEKDDDEGARADDAAPALEPTGDERVDAAVERLGEVPRRPPAEHVAIYEDVHRRLQDSLADLDGS